MVAGKEDVEWNHVVRVESRPRMVLHIVGLMELLLSCIAAAAAVLVLVLVLVPRYIWKLHCNLRSAI